MNPIRLSCLLLFCALAVQAQLAVTVSPPKITGQKAVVKLAMTNNLTETVESARAACFLLDTQGTIIGQSTKWVIGGTKGYPALNTKDGTTYNFVITSPRPFTNTNLTAKVSFSSIVFDGGKAANVRQSVKIIGQETE